MEDHNLFFFCVTLLWWQTFIRSTLAASTPPAPSSIFFCSAETHGKSLLIHNPNPTYNRYCYYLVDILVLTIGKILKLWVWGYMLGARRPNFYDEWQRQSLSFSRFFVTSLPSTISGSAGSASSTHRDGELLTCPMEKEIDIGWEGYSKSNHLQQFGKLFLKTQNDLCFGNWWNWVPFNQEHFACRTCIVDPFQIFSRKFRQEFWGSTIKSTSTAQWRVNFLHDFGTLPDFWFSLFLQRWL